MFPYRLTENMALISSAYSVGMTYGDSNEIIYGARHDRFLVTDKPFSNLACCVMTLWLCSKDLINDKLVSGTDYPFNFVGI
jgi:hypothetical protein